MIELMELINSFPRWILKGNSPTEVHEKYKGPKLQEKPPQLIMGPNMKKAGINISQEEVNDLWEKNAVRSTPKIGRNEPCPCGSGKKYKHCCGSN
ncbi:MAG: SEC-C metal-binding domain-containing protein [Bacteroidales bacterium]|nr:SEC-C metal-binding domain-containing protein [Bacteroidales bacterium]